MMTQTAQVKQILSDGSAEITVTRQGACSHNCAECGGCSTSVLPTVTARAKNPLGARLGDMVVVTTPSHKLLGVAALVYLLPMALLILGYALGAAAGLSEGGAMLAGAGFFAASIGLVLLLDRRVKARRSLEFTIVRIKEV